MDLVWVLIAIIPCLFFLLRAKKRLPGPWNLPVLGYLPWLSPTEPYLTLTELANRYGPVYGLQLGAVFAVVVSDAQLVRRAFSSEAAAGRAPLHLTHGIMRGYGLICAQGDLWKDQRKFVYHSLRLLGAMRTPNRSRMEALILDNVQELIQTFKNCNSSPLDPLKALRHSLGSVINVIVFGKAWAKDDPIWEWLLHLQEEGTKLIGVAGPLNFLPFLRFLPSSKQTLRFLLEGKEKTHNIYKNIIQEQSKIFNDTKEVTNLIQAFLAEKSKRSIEDQDKYYNNEQFYHLLADIFGASLDTTLTTLRWYFLYLATHQNIQKRVRTEIFNVIEVGTVLSMEHLPNMPYVEASIAETQRIRSVVPVGIPHGTVDCLQIGPYQIPKGTMIVPLQWAIHMDSKQWPQPDKFDPMRFIGEDGRFFKPEAFLPFQTGKRMCVGDELARMLLFLFGASIVQNFEIGTDGTEPDLNGECGITLTPKPYQLVFKPI